MPDTEVFGSNGSLGMDILSVTPKNPLLCAFIMQNFTLGMAMSVIPENPLFPNPLLPKTSVLARFFPYAGQKNKKMRLEKRFEMPDLVLSGFRKNYY